MTRAEFVAKLAKEAGWNGFKYSPAMKPVQEKLKRWRLITIIEYRDAAVTVSKEFMPIEEERL